MHEPLAPTGICHLNFIHRQETVVFVSKSLFWCDTLDVNRKGQQWPVVEPKTPLAWAATALPLSHDSQITTNHNIIEDCDCDHWQLKLSWVQLLETANLFTFLYVHIITSKFLFPQREGCWTMHFLLFTIMTQLSYTHFFRCLYSTLHTHRAKLSHYTV